jgi:hypothetical protein
MANFPSSEISGSPATHGVVLGEVKAVALIPPMAPPYVSGKWYSAPDSNNSTGILDEAKIYVGWHPVPFGVTIAGVAEEVTTIGTAGALRRLVIYKHNISTGLPDALLDDLGTYDATTTGVKTITGRTAVVDNYGGVWVGGITQGAAGTRPTVRSTIIQSPAIALSSASFLANTICGWATTAATHTGAAPANIGALAASGGIARTQILIG